MILDDIIFNKRQEVTALKTRQSKLCGYDKPRTAGKTRDFKKIFKQGKIALIAECKKASPSAGVIQEEYFPDQIAKQYEAGGAGAISVLTDRKYFHGDNEHLKAVKSAVKTPVLRKDFIIDESQIYESRAIGADAILLIARVLTDSQLAEFIKLTEKLGMQALVEAHDEADVEKALLAKAKIIGINNRDLATFQTNINVTLDLMKKFPQLKKHIIISESGIKTREDIVILQKAGVSGVLVGETLMKARDIKTKVKELFES